MTRPTCNGGYRLVPVPWCTCGWGFPHEPDCGWEIDDRTEPRRLGEGWPEPEVDGGEQRG